MPDSRPTEGASFPTSPARHSMPVWYPELLDSVSKRITVGRLRATLADRLSADLRKGFPDAKGYSPRNLKYMRAFAEAWPDPEVVQGRLAQLPWWSQIALLEKLKTADQHLC